MPLETQNQPLSTAPSPEIFPPSPERSLMGPEAIIMLTAAGAVDLTELAVNLIPLVGQILSFMLNTVALIFFGAWILFRQGAIPPALAQRSAAQLSRFGKWMRKTRWLKPLLIFVQFIPIVGAVIPAWTFLVFMEIKSS